MAQIGPWCCTSIWRLPESGGHPESTFFGLFSSCRVIMGLNEAPRQQWALPEIFGAKLFSSVPQCLSPAMLCHWVKLVHTTITAIMTRKICDNFCPDSWILVSCWRPCSTAAGKPALQSSHLFASWPIFQTCDPNSLTRHRQRQERRITSYWRIIKGPTIVAQLIACMLFTYIKLHTRCLHYVSGR